MNLFEAQAHVAAQHNGDDWGSMGAEDTRFTGKPEMIDLNSTMGEEIEYRQSFNKSGKVVIVKVKVPRIKKAIDENELAMGVVVEMEHTTDKKVAKKIALDHLKEDGKYYTKLKKIHKEK